MEISTKTDGKAGANGRDMAIDLQESVSALLPILEATGMISVEREYLSIGGENHATGRKRVEVMSDRLHLWLVKAAARGTDSTPEKVTERLSQIPGHRHWYWLLTRLDDAAVRQLLEIGKQQMEAKDGSND